MRAEPRMAGNLSDYPHITVATVVEQAGRFLLVEERADGQLVYNQPAGHLELGETLISAALRETLEETAWEVEITCYLGLYHYRSEANGITYLRNCFVARPLRERRDLTLDTDIVRTVWLSAREIQARESRLRSPMVWRAVQDFQRGVRYPLDIIRTDATDSMLPQTTHASS